MNHCLGYLNSEAKKRRHDLWTAATSVLAPVLCLGWG